MLIAAPSPVESPQANRQAPVERRLGVDLRERDLGHHRVLGEGRGAHEVADLLAVALQAGGPVGQVALALLLADRQAEVGAVVDAVDALAALRAEQRDDVVADGRGTRRPGRPPRRPRRPRGRAPSASSRTGRRPRPCRGRCGRRRRRRGAPGPRPPSGPSARAPGSRGARRTPPIPLRASSSVTPRFDCAPIVRAARPGRRQAATRSRLTEAGCVRKPSANVSNWRLHICKRCNTCLVTVGTTGHRRDKRMTDAAIHERVCGIRGELLELIGMLGSPATRFELTADMMLDDLLVVANRLGRVAEGIRRSRPVALDCPRAVSSAGRALPLQGRGRRFESGTAHRPAWFAAAVAGSLPRRWRRSSSSR